jgi:hypothetical protein
MGNFHLISFSLGIIVSIVYSLVKNYIKNKSLKKSYLEPFKNLLDKPKEYFRFGSRNKDLVIIYYGEKKSPYLFVNLETKKVAILDGNTAIGVQTEIIQKEVGEFYEKIINFFKEEIYVNVTTINGEVYSNNITDSALTTEIIKAVQDSGIVSKIMEGEIHPENKDVNIDVNAEIDRILDKISESGIESLTDKERIFLDNNTK